MSNDIQHDHGFDSIVDVDWLAERLGRDDLVIADCRFELADRDAGHRAYRRDHIPGAIFFDLERHLSRPADIQNISDGAGSTRAVGGRHPLPSVEQMTQLFSKAGIGDGVKVICYDDQKGSMAARLWWMLRFLGHRDVALLDGGYTAWRKAGHPVTSQQSMPSPRSFVPRPQAHMVASADDVRQLIGAGRGVVIDSRAPERYRGEIEPLDPVAGHIPGAINMPWDGNIDEQGQFLRSEALVKRFETVRDRVDTADKSSVIVHCGSGVTGCVNVLGLERAGVQSVKLYVGGWSEWCSDPNNPVATGASDV